MNFNNIVLFGYMNDFENYKKIKHLNYDIEIDNINNECIYYNYSTIMNIDLNYFIIMNNDLKSSAFILNFNDIDINLIPDSLFNYRNKIVIDSNKLLQNLKNKNKIKINFNIIRYKNTICLQLLLEYHDQLLIETNILKNIIPNYNNIKKYLCEIGKYLFKIYDLLDNTDFLDEYLKLVNYDRTVFPKYIKVNNIAKFLEKIKISNYNKYIELIKKHELNKNKILNDLIFCFSNKNKNLNIKYDFLTLHYNLNSIKFGFCITYSFGKNTIITKHNFFNLYALFELYGYLDKLESEIQQFKLLNS